MDSKSIFSTLIELPLFRGVTREKMFEVVGKAKSHFLKYKQGTEFISPGEPCNHLKFLLHGMVRITFSNRDGSFSVSQTLANPDVIAPEYLFGMATDFPCNVVALTPTSVLQISKPDYLSILNTDSVFMLNYLNLLAMNSQKNVDGIMSLSDGRIEKRVAFWIIALSKPSSRDIVLEAGKRDFSAIFGVEHARIVEALDKMKQRGLIDYTADKINVHDRRGVLKMLHDREE